MRCMENICTSTYLTHTHAYNEIDLVDSKKANEMANILYDIDIRYVPMYSLAQNAITIRENRTVCTSFHTEIQQQQL